MAYVSPILIPVPPGKGSQGAAIAAAGGLYRPAGTCSDDDLVAEVERQGARALIYNRETTGLLSRLPGLEFVRIGSFDPEPEDLYHVPNLRGLDLAQGWHRPIDFTRFPSLEWVSVVDVPKGGGGLDTLVSGHANLRYLSVNTAWPWEDLSPLGALPRLAYLKITGSRRLRSLRGVEAVGSTLSTLILELCPAFTDGGELGAVPGLRMLQVHGSTRWSDVGVVASMPSLELLDLSNTTVDSLGPLAGHPGLRLVFAAGVADADLAPLGTIPRLEKARVGKADLSWLGLPEIGWSQTDHPLVRDWFEALDG